ncbi:MAG TPA: TIGR02530 family flagellar biosynthesis protein [Bacteroidota bacterium]|nr:TIGR02530 family flagellar biosynthesis protein [Bacteroidota bacterium]
MADTYINGVRVPFLPARGVDGLKQRTQTGGTRESSFENVLQEELRGLTFSRHARERLEARNMQLNEADMTTLQLAVNRAEEKGVRDSLVLLRDMAFIVSVPNRTVVTAMDSEHLKENVFTNIDSAVIA